MVKGRIHSLESFGTVDGPGTRFVVFLQGCLLRCQYCHNPDTWDAQGGKEVSSSEVFQKITSLRKYFDRNGGGVTLSGGDPLLQAEFALDVFKKCKAEGIHTCLDTAGAIWDSNVSELLDYTDLVLLDIKSWSEAKHLELTGLKNKNTLNLLKILNERGVSTWIRYVLVPGLTDDPQEVASIADYVSQFACVEKVEVLPFHQMGSFKWESLGLDYKLKDVSVPSAELTNEFREIFASRGIKEVK